jgi:hypothetical protein
MHLSQKQIGFSRNLFIYQAEKQPGRKDTHQKTTDAELAG